MRNSHQEGRLREQPSFLISIFNTKEEGKEKTSAL
jgi:hypothetical protein